MTSQYNSTDTRNSRADMSQPIGGVEDMHSGGQARESYPADGSQVLTQLPDLGGHSQDPFLSGGSSGSGNRFLGQKVSMKLLVGAGVALVLVAVLPFFFDNEEEPAADTGDKPSWVKEMPAADAEPAPRWDGGSSEQYPAPGEGLEHRAQGDPMVPPHWNHDPSRTAASNYPAASSYPNTGLPDTAQVPRPTWNEPAVQPPATPLPAPGEVSGSVPAMPADGDYSRVQQANHWEQPARPAERGEYDNQYRPGSTGRVGENTRPWQNPPITTDMTGRRVAPQDVGPISQTYQRPYQQPQTDMNRGDSAAAPYADGTAYRRENQYRQDPRTQTREGAEPYYTARRENYRTDSQTVDPNAYRTDPNTYRADRPAADPNTYRTDPNTYRTDPRTVDPNAYRADPNTYRTDPRTVDPNTYRADPNTYRTDPRTADPNTYRADPRASSSGAPYNEYRSPAPSNYRSDSRSTYPADYPTERSSMNQGSYPPRYPTEPGVARFEGGITNPTTRNNL